MPAERTTGPARPTLEEVAARAGVGRGTVSRVVNNSPRVSPHAREAVQRAIEELGYVPNRAARTLVTNRTDSIALVVSESGERFFAEPFFAGIVRAISAELAGTGLQLLLAIAQSAEERQRLERHLTRQHVDGVLLVSLHGDDPLPRRLEEQGMPTVLGGRPTGPEPVSYVDADNRGGARTAVSYLASKGRRHIGTVAGPRDMAVGIDRLEGYFDGLRAAGLPVDERYVAYGDFSQDSGAAGARELLGRCTDLDAVFAASDPMAVGALRELHAAGLRVPDDIALVGFDDSPVALHTDPPLTTLHQPVDEMGRAMVELLLARIRGGEVPRPRITLGTELVVRGSA